MAFFGPGGFYVGLFRGILRVVASYRFLRGKGLREDFKGFLRRFFVGGAMLLGMLAN